MHDKQPIQIRFELDELAAIDSYRRTQANPPTRPQAIRDLLRHALSERAPGSAPRITHDRRPETPIPVVPKPGRNGRERCDRR
jgi:hypothetical protein